VIYISAPYKRTYEHTKSRGHEKMVRCAFCGKLVPKYKAIVIKRGFHLDRASMKSIDRRFVSQFEQKMYICPSCARARGIVQIGKSRKSRTPNKRKE